MPEAHDIILACDATWGEPPVNYRLEVELLGPNPRGGRLCRVHLRNAALPADIEPEVRMMFIPTSGDDTAALARAELAKLGFTVAE